MKQREANFELLRIVAMLMIITLHYLDKGGILPEPAGAFTTTGYTAWGLEAFCVPAVNVYVLISAYFLADSDYRPWKAAKLWIQVFVYSVGIAVVLLAVGVIPTDTMDKYAMMNYLFPVVEEHYWFVTAYLLLYLLAPLMNETLRALSKRTLGQGLGLLLLLLSVSASFLPVKLPIDRLGYDVVWFLCLYLTGAYLRYHGLPWVCRGAETDAEKTAGRTGGSHAINLSTGRAFAGYFLCSLLIFVSLIVIHGVYMRTGSLGEFIKRQYQYNSIFCFLSSVFLFCAFGTLRIRNEKWAAGICRAASVSFGVYLIHEHIGLRYLWPVWLGTERFTDTPLFLLHWIPSILLVYGSCMAIDFVRQFLFQRTSLLFRKRGTI